MILDVFLAAKQAVLNNMNQQQADIRSLTQSYNRQLPLIPDTELQCVLSVRHHKRHNKNPPNKYSIIDLGQESKAQRGKIQFLPLITLSHLRLRVLILRDPFNIGAKSIGMTKGSAD